MTEVQRRIKERDIQGIRNIFLDSLDIDPTFEKYRDDYEQCKDIMFEQHEKLTPFSKNSSDWDNSYWLDIKFDQKQNFSFERFEHMRTVAQVIYKDKVERLQLSRQEARKDYSRGIVHQTNVMEATREQSSAVLHSAEQQRQQIVSSNQRAAEIKRRDEERLAAVQRQIEEQNRAVDRDSEGYTMDGESKQESSKKSEGIVIAVAVIVVVGAILVNLLANNPK